MIFKIHLPPSFYDSGDGVLRVKTTAKTVRDLLTAAEKRIAKKQGKIFDDKGEIKKHLNVFLNGEEIGCKSGEKIKIKTGDEILIMQSLAGG